MRRISERFKAVDIFARCFEFIMSPLADQCTDVVQEQAKCLAENYPNDIIKDELEEELRHFVLSVFSRSGGIVKKKSCLRYHQPHLRGEA